MAEDISANSWSSGDLVVEIDLDATANDAVEVTFPNWAKSFIPNFFTSAGVAEAGKVASSGTDSSPIGSDADSIAASAKVAYNLGRIPPAKPVYYLAGASNSAKCVLVVSAQSV